MGVNSHLTCGILPKGHKNMITDVHGVKVGHVTYDDGSIQTGVTAIIPGQSSPFLHKFPAAVHVINGFGKSCGLMQIQELGTLETPILLTNTFSVCECASGLLTYMLENHEEIGTTTGTVNPVVLECNDGHLNAIRKRVITSEDAIEAMRRASFEVVEGAVGAGRGMRCYGYKGGIGTASRVVTLGNISYTVGALLLTNFGSKRDLLIHPNAIANSSYYETEQGSCICILATDIPLSCRQLTRCTKRIQNGLAKTGSITGGGSGEIGIMFSTANRIPHYSSEALLSVQCLHEDFLDTVFRAVIECVHESVVSSLFHAESVTGRDGITVEKLPIETVHNGQHDGLST